MKILEKRYPLGTIPKQQTPGRYINETLHKNIKLLAKNVMKDMTYLGIITSSTLEVGAGKSVFAQQFAEAYLELIKQFHKIDNKLSMENLVFRPKDIIERSFKVPQYSVIICDEWEDLHYWSELGKTLRQFFRKCRQLNLLIIVIIPNFFQLPMSYAISRSVFLIDVKFTGEFNRGYFSFYNFNKKKSLFIKGKKKQDYGSVKPNFTGRFVDGYVVDEEQYRIGKLKDLTDQEDLEKKPEFNPRQLTMELFYKVYKNAKVSVEMAARWFGVTGRTGFKWISDIRQGNTKESDMSSETKNTLIVYPTKSDDIESVEPTMEKEVKKEQ